MTKFHINKSGKPSVCKAKSGKCPFGSQESHFDSKEEAEVYLSVQNEQHYGILPNTNSKLENVFSKEHIEILDRLNENGFKAYFVGGSIRDALIDKPIHDVDITTSANPEEIIEAFSDCKVLPTGLKHGTVFIMYKGEQIEITSFRKEGEYSDGRRPDEVTFTKDLDEDINRRDFTINSFAYNPKEGLVDLVNGKADLESGLIRTVGSPDERFQEDPLRMMRGLRFASKMGFDIEPETEASIFRNKHLLKNVSNERIQSEFNGIIMGSGSKEVLMKYSSVLSEVIPEITPMIGFDQKNPVHKYDVWEHSATVVENAEENLVHRLAGVFHDSGKPSTFSTDEKGVGHFFGHAEESAKIAEVALTRLKYDNKTKERVVNLIIDHDKELPKKDYKIKKKIFEEGPERVKDYLQFIRADDKGKNAKKNSRFEHIDNKEQMVNEYLNGNPILSRKDIAVNGKDLSEIGFKGKEIADMLEKLSLGVIGGNINEKDRLLKIAKKEKRWLKIFGDK